MGARRLLAVALAASCSVVLGGNVQKSGLKVPAEYAANKTAVVGIFNDSYSAYKFVHSMLALFVQGADERV